MVSLFHKEKQKMPCMVLLYAQDQAAPVCTMRALLSREALGGSSRGSQPSSLFTQTFPAFPVCRNPAAGPVMALL